jgi:hypothetical protein
MAFPLSRFRPLSATIRSTDTTRSAPSRRNTTTPCAERPCTLIEADRHANGLPGVGNQHQIVAFLDREGGDDGAVLLAHAHGDDARAAAPGDAVFELDVRLPKPFSDTASKNCSPAPSSA